jgi:hypothetical protein
MEKMELYGKCISPKFQELYKGVWAQEVESLHGKHERMKRVLCTISDKDAVWPMITHKTHFHFEQISHHEDQRYSWKGDINWISS